MIDQEMADVYYGSLLHDLGKLVQRADINSKRASHQTFGADFLAQYTDNQNIIDALRYHHNQFGTKNTNLRTAKVADNAPVYLTYIGDNIAAGTDRRYEEELQSGWDSKTPMSDIFNRFSLKLGKRYLPASSLDEEDFTKMEPLNSRLDFTQAEYAKILETFKAGIMSVKLTPEYVDSVLNLVEGAMSQIPSDTASNGEPDISLYDHMKLTAAFACSAKQYLDQLGIDDYKTEILKHADKFYERPSYLMVGYRFEGSEDFINSITSKGAYKQLKSRAFYVEMLVRNFLDDLLDRLNLTGANILYQNSHDGLLVVGNTTQNVQGIKQAQKELNDFLTKKFGTKLYMAIGFVEFSSNQVKVRFTKTSEEAAAEYKRVGQNYAWIFDNIEKQINVNSLQRYQKADLLQLNKQGKRQGRECAVCHSVSDLLPDENKCVLCDTLENFSKSIQNEEYFLVNQDPSGLQLGEHTYLHTTTEDEIKDQTISGRVYAKNSFKSGYNQATHIWVSDYSESENNDFTSYADREWTEKDAHTVGIRRLGSLMIDIDDLRAKFLTGFYPQDEGKYTTISRFAEFSRRLDLFFKLYLNQFAEDSEYHLSIIYSQGDKVFILGAWDDLLDFAQILHDEFAKWTDGKLTFSAGLGMFNPSTPINIISRETNELLNAAKLEGKDRIALFAKDNILTFSDYRDDILYGKLVTIQEFFDHENQRGKAFIYKLISLIRERDEQDRISFARLAYFLSRLESESENKQAFKTFKEKLIEWFDDELEIKQAELALMLYVYSIREE